MEDITFILVILGLFFLLNAMVLVAYWTCRHIIRTASAGQLDPQGWQSSRKLIGYVLSVANFAYLIFLAIWFRQLDTWMLAHCRNTESNQNDCAWASKVWNKFIWCLALPFVVFFFRVMTSSLRAYSLRTRALASHNPGLMYDLSYHAQSWGFFQLTMLLSMPIACPTIFFKHVAWDTWVIASIVVAELMLTAYMAAIACWIDGLALMQHRSHLSENRVNRQPEILIQLENLGINNLPV